jgi:4-carboxymuconolactone decarboxylase
VDLPPDIHPESRNRLPPVVRAELDPEGQQLYDEIVGDARSFVGLHGPGAIRLRAPRLARLARPESHYLRFDAGLDPRLSEIITLATARELDQDYEWTNHERIGLRAGVEPEVIDVIRHRRPLDGLGEREAALISVARETLGDHRVTSATFANALRLFGTQTLVLYVALMGHYASLACLLHVFANQLPAGEESTLPR